ncbi:MAG: hypothetical protein U0821_14205 [Chloroflexota bacterium]
MSRLSRGRRAIGRVIVTLALVLAGGSTATAAPAGLPAPPQWEPLPLAHRVTSETRINGIFAPPGGPLYALLDRVGTFRSDDEGLSWTDLRIPISLQLQAVDPVDHRRLYLTGSGGIYVSEDAGRTFDLILNIGYGARHVVVSPADPSVVYAAAISSEAMAPGGQKSWLFRSRDRGRTWKVLPDETATGTFISVGPLMSDPRDANRLMVQADAGGVSFPTRWRLRETRDQGESWTEGIHLACGSPRSLARAGETLWLTTSFSSGVCGGQRTGYLLWRSEDDGAAWAVVHEWPRFGVHPVVADQTVPDRLYAGVSRPLGAGVITSADGGATWSPLGGEEPGDIRHLVLSADGRYLYAAGERLWRLRLGPDS